MIWSFDTSKKVTKEVLFMAEVIKVSAEDDLTVDESIELMKQILRNKEKET